MDDHARRICAPLVAAWADFESGRATLLDLARLAEQAANLLVGRRMLEPVLSVVNV